MKKYNKKDIYNPYFLDDLEFAISEYIKWKKYALEELELLNKEKYEYVVALKFVKKMHTELQKAIVKYAKNLKKFDKK